MSKPPGDPICATCWNVMRRPALVRTPEGPMDGPWREDGSKPPISEMCSLCECTSIAGLYLQKINPALTPAQQMLSARLFDQARLIMREHYGDET